MEFNQRFDDDLGKLIKEFVEGKKEEVIAIIEDWYTSASQYRTKENLIKRIKALK